MGDADHLGSPGDRPGWLDGLPESKIQAHADRVEAREDTDTTDGSAIAGPNARNWGSGSRPSKNNCKSPSKEGEPSEDRISGRYWWHRKNETVDEILDTLPQRANRPAAVREKAKLRNDCVRDRADGGYRSKPMSDVIREFLGWYNDYRHAHLLFNGPDGNVVRSKMENSHQPGYGNRYYARFKALERQVVREYDDPHSCILTFSGSHENVDGNWRCPVDHLRDVIDTWRPDRGGGVYHQLRRSLEGMEWEYCVGVEHNSKGYGHVHVGVFVDGEITESDFHNVIDEHLRLCDIAHRDAHNYYHPNSEKNPISVRRIEPGLEPEDYDGSDDVVGNVASYLAEYIGAADESELFDRSPQELYFRAACWSSGTQRVRFSTGANEMIRRDRDEPQRVETTGPVNPGWKPGATSEKIEKAVADPDRSGTEWLEKPDEGNWSLHGIGRVDDDGETVFEIEQSTVQYREIHGAESLDPPKKLPSDRPQPPSTDSKLTEYE